MRTKILLMCILLSYFAFGQEKNKIVIIGTFHFHLAKSQFGVDFNILSKEHQAELNTIAEQIAKFKPTKIFVEWESTKQTELNDLYNMYLKDKSYQLIKEKYGINETMYFESEIQQLGFRVANKSAVKTLYAFDYLIPEPNDTIMNSMQKNNQSALMDQIQQEFNQYGQSIISAFQKVKSIKELLLFFSSEDLANRLNRGYITLFNKIGNNDDFSGAYFVSERYRRNLYMYSLIQKQIEKNDERILVIVGAQHAAAFQEFSGNDSSVEVMTLSQLLDE